MMALAAFATLSGCTGAPEVAGETTEAVSAALFANDKAAYDFFVAKGLTNFQSAGIVGNLDQESGVNPASVQYGGGPGRGIAQWSVGGRWDTSNNDNVLAYAKTTGQSSGSLNLQLEFIWYELTTFGYGLSQLKASTNLTDATVAFMAKYEICGTCAQTQRIAYAQAVLNAYGAAPPYSATFVSQSWPSATTPLTLKCGESIAAKIVLKNTGTKTWDGSTRLATTMQRDRASDFAGSDWVAPNRAAAIKGTVAPNADGTFAFSFHGPTGAGCVPGSYHEFFGVVQEGVAWFSDNGQGGPPDNQLEALINLVPGDPGSTGGGSPPGADGGTTGQGGGGGGGGTGGGAGSGGAGDNPGTGGNGGTTTGSGSQGGCAVGGSASSDGLVLLFACALVVARVRRRIRW
ncbi:MAG: hypothetical protein JWN44_4001 [Myxococcales bacterium]|nr:hypothetical protein [Myxococcales bacterium]